MSELQGQHFIGKPFSCDDVVELVSIHDENGMWVLDCFESGAEEILARINMHEQLVECLEMVADADDDAKANGEAGTPLCVRSKIDWAIAKVKGE